MVVYNCAVHRIEIILRRIFRTCSKLNFPPPNGLILSINVSHLQNFQFIAVIVKCMIVRKQKLQHICMYIFLIASFPNRNSRVLYYFIIYIYRRFFVLLSLSPSKVFLVGLAKQSTFFFGFNMTLVSGS
jgi:hypothetical protein